MFEFREYQKDIINKAVDVCKKYRFVYLAMEVRTGKTLTSLGIASALGCKNVLFLTKKKAITSINDDYDMLCPNSFTLFTINYESMHKLPNVKWDFIVIDEAHSLGAFPKPSKRARGVRDIIKKCKPIVCLMSGTPTPESYSQMYHQVFGVPSNPFKEYTNFYKFAKKYVNVTQRKINSLFVNDYSKGLVSILDAMKPMTIAYTQKEAGFVSTIDEEIMWVPMNDITYDMTKRLSTHRVVEGKDEVILGDTPVKLMMKLHQLYSGTIKFESGNSMILDYTKANYINYKFIGKKIGIFYKFKEELKLLKDVYGDTICTELEEFNNTDKSIALQIVSGREGISLRKAEALVYYNIDFSATSYWQSRDRMTTKDRKNSKVYWVFSEGGIEKDIYKAVIKKKDYTVRHFKKDLLNL